MKSIHEGTLLWNPSQTRKEQANITHYMKWLREQKGLSFHNYDDLWQWSVHNLEDFWESQWEYFNIYSTKPYNTVLTSNQMPGAKWFADARINYVEHIFRNRHLEHPAIIHTSETRENREVTWGKLYEDTVAMQQTFIKLGLQKGDRVVAYLPNIYETIVCFLATASLGAIWSSASPDFGTQSVIDRFKQIAPKMMITVDGYTYNGKSFDRLSTIENIQAELPSLEATITIPYLHKNAKFNHLKNTIAWNDAVKRTEVTELIYEYVEFNEPLWVLFSSGTTGVPKPIVHSQGGILLEHLKAVTFHVDLSDGDRFFWYTTTGWMMWNFLVGGLLAGSTIILYDGSPTYPHHHMLWQLAEDTKMTVFGTSASYLTACIKDGVEPGKEFNLQHLKNISSTGSPLPPEGFLWCYEHVKQDLWIASISGGTDVCTAFILGAPILPVYAGELQCRGLGASIESFDETGKAELDKVGELVLTKPFPAMPIYFWNDQDGSRYRDSYFDMFPGIWRHGDYVKLTERGTCIIYGRSDATINRGGIRIGTSEIYRAIDQIDGIKDSLIVDIPLNNGDSFVPLFIILNKDIVLTDTMKKEINNQIRIHCSPRHVPNAIYAVPDIPRTLNGKKLEVPVKKILMGQPLENVVNQGSLRNPETLSYFINFTKEHL
ncbi:acetoacetate--CoA ligase [Virgibacillus soli]|uniref:acetoacetate--CoA ligase n=1 Tax=Paracerasibacillus soli TaxID=480284 RepID=UPI0035EAA5DA